MSVELVTTPAGEVRVEQGSGIVDKIEHTHGGRNARVVLKATHTNLAQPVSGWVDTTAGDAWQVAQEALAGKFVVDYRIEVHRKRDVGPDRPIAQLANTEKVRDVVALARTGELAQADKVPAQPPYPPTTPVADETPDQAAGEPEEAGWLTQAGKEATEQRQAHRPAEETAPANYCPLCEFTATDQRDLIAHARGLQHRANVTRANATTPSSAATFDAAANPRDLAVPAPANRRGPRMEEGKPWELYLTDQRTLNLASYAFGAVVELVELAHYIVTQRVADTQAAGEPHEFRMGQVEAVAKTLLEAADKVQAATRQDQRVDRMDGSHKRARYAVKTALKVYPVPFGVDVDTRRAWLAQLVEHAAAILSISYDLFRDHEQGDLRP